MKTLERTGPSPWLVAAICGCALLTFHVWSLLRFPAPFVDEAWYASRAWSFLQDGIAFGTLDRGVFDRFEGYWTYFQVVPVLVQSAALWVARAPSLMAVRVVSLAAGAVLAAAVYAVAQRVGGRRNGALAVLFLSTSLPFLFSAHLGRYDIIAAAFGFGAIALEICNRDGRAWMSGVAGLAFGLAFEVHPFAAVYGPVLGLLHVHSRGWRVWRCGAFWSLVAGALVGGLFYASLHLLPYPATYVALNGLVYGPTHTPPIATGSPVVMLKGLGHELAMIFLAYPFGFPAVAVAHLCLVRSRNRGERTALLVSTVLLMSHALLVRNKFPYYRILVTPAVDIVLATYVTREILTNLPKSRAIAALALAALAFVGAAAVCYSAVRVDRMTIYGEVQERINHQVKGHDVIMASQTYWFGLSHHSYFSWEQLVYYRRYAPGSSLADAMAQFRPDVLILDGQMDTYLVGDHDRTPYGGLLSLPRADLADLLAKRGVLVDRFDGKLYGTVRVYRLDWAGSTSSGAALW